MNKVRVYEVARELGVENRELLAKIASLGIQVRNHMSSLDAGDLERLKRALEKDKQQNVVEERIRPTVVRRRSVHTAARAAAAPAPQPEIEEPAALERKPAAPAPARAPAKRQPKAAAARKAAAAEQASAPETAASPKAPVAPAPTPQISQPEVPAPAAPPKVAPIAAAEVGEPAPAESQPEAFPSDRPSHPPSYEERLGASNLPPGVVARGNQVVGPRAVLSAEQRSRIVTQHAEQKRTDDAQVTAVPRRRELARAAIGPTGRQQARPGRPGRARKPAPGKKAQKTELTVPSAQKRVIRIEDRIGLQSLAQRMSLKATEVLMKLMQMGMTGVMINSTLDSDTAKIVASEFGFEVENVAVSFDEFVDQARGPVVDEEGAREMRAPVVTVMGHVDHGKTSLLDKIRKTDVAVREHGGITQHIGAYRVETKKGPLVFIDTPGHAAFTAMRARGAHATDVVILVVAADDGVMPQTVEAIDHAKDAKVPIVVAVNKIDKPNARADTVMRELAKYELQPEEWGGDILFVNVSALTGDGIDTLLENVALQSEMLELKANPRIPAQGVVLEAYVDKGRGPVANLLVKNGTLRTGNFLVAGEAFGKVRAMTDDRGKQTSKAGPSTPVEVLGLSEVPQAGDGFDVVTDAKVAQQLVDRRKAASGPAVAGPEVSRIGLNDLMQKMQQAEIEELKLVVKADVQGSSEALVKALGELSSDKVKVSVVHSGVGAIAESDVMLASASHAIVVGFGVRPTGGAVKTSKSERIEIRTYNVIYDVIDDVKAAMAGLLKPELVERSLGKAEIRQVFNVAKGKIAGCFVSEGKISRSAKARLVRDSVQVWEGNIKSLRRVKDDVKEVASGLECGIALDNFNDIKENDVIESFEIQEVAGTL
jgi:translation initiation factor IF-2